MNRKSSPNISLTVLYTRPQFMLQREKNLTPQAFSLSTGAWALQAHVLHASITTGPSLGFFVSKVLRNCSNKGGPWSQKKYLGGLLGPKGWPVRRGGGWAHRVGPMDGVGPIGPTSPIHKPHGLVGSRGQTPRATPLQAYARFALKTSIYPLRPLRFKWFTSCHALSDPGIKLPFFNRSFDKKRLKLLFSWYFANKGEVAAFSLVETLQKLGFTYAMKAGISLGIDDLQVPKTKGQSLSEAVELLNVTRAFVNNGNITILEEFQQFVDTWHRTSENLKKGVVENFTRGSFGRSQNSTFAKNTKQYNSSLQKKQFLFQKLETLKNVSFVQKVTTKKTESTREKNSKINSLEPSPSSNSTNRQFYKSLLRSYGNTLNPVYMMAFSGARGNLSQVRQLVGMRGLMADPQGQLVEFPIQSNFREGLTVTEYMISCYGARKGLVDTALRTAAAGYLTRRLVDVSHHQIVRFVTCGTKNGIWLPLQNKNEQKPTSLPSAWKVSVKKQEVLEDKFEDRKIPSALMLLNSQSEPRLSPSTGSEKLLGSLGQHYSQQQKLKPLAVGRVLARDIPGLAFRNQEIDISLGSSPFFQKVYETSGIYVRSPLTCGAETGICQLCYGWSVSANRLIGLGEAVGIIAAQSIGEPGTQLTMRTFHTGGVFSGDIMEECRAKHGGTVCFHGTYLGLLVRTAGGAIAFCMKTPGIFHIKGTKKQTTYNVTANTLLFVRQGETVLTDSLLAQIPNLPEIEETTGESTKTIVSSLPGEVRQTTTKNLELENICILAGQKVIPTYFSQRQFFNWGHKPSLPVKIGEISNTSKALPMILQQKLEANRSRYFVSNSVPFVLSETLLLQKKKNLSVLQREGFVFMIPGSHRLSNRCAPFLNKKSLRINPSFSKALRINRLKTQMFYLLRYFSPLQTHKNSFLAGRFENCLSIKKKESFDKKTLQFNFYSARSDFLLTILKTLPNPKVLSIVSILNKKKTFRIYTHENSIEKKKQEFFHLFCTTKQKQKKQTYKGNFINCRSYEPLIPDSFFHFILWYPLKQILQNISNLDPKEHITLPLFKTQQIRQKKVENWVLRCGSNKLFGCYWSAKGVKMKPISSQYFAKKFTSKFDRLGPMDVVSWKQTPHSYKTTTSTSTISLQYFANAAKSIGPKIKQKQNPITKQISQVKLFFYSLELENNAYLFWTVSSLISLRVFLLKKKKLSFKLQTSISDQWWGRKYLSTVYTHLPPRSLVQTHQLQTVHNVFLEVNTFIQEFSQLSRKMLSRFAVKKNFYSNNNVKLVSRTNEQQNFYPFSSDSRFQNSGEIFPIQGTTRSINFQKTSYFSDKGSLLAPQKFFSTPKKTRDSWLTCQLRKAKKTRQLHLSNYPFELGAQALDRNSRGLSPNEDWCWPAEQGRLAIGSEQAKTAPFWDHRAVLRKSKPQYYSNKASQSTKNPNLNILLMHYDRISYKVEKFVPKRSSSISRIGCFVNTGDEIFKNKASAVCGQVIEKSCFQLTLRYTQNILYPNLHGRPAKVSREVKDGNWLQKGTSLVTLPYISSVTGDIVAGIPKIEQLFEARGETLEELIDKIWCSYKLAIVPKAKAVRESFKEIGLFVVQAIQKVYSSQGVQIADKHLEVIIRQMTRRAIIIDPGDTEFLADEFVDLKTIECVNWTTYGEIASYRPRLIGITKASLTSNSFLSSASFQQTARVLERETFLEKTDRLLGLKERVMMGALIDAGTGSFQTAVRVSNSIRKKTVSTEIFKRLGFFSRRKIEQVRINN